MRVAVLLAFTSALGLTACSTGGPGTLAAYTPPPAPAPTPPPPPPPPPTLPAATDFTSWSEFGAAATRPVLTGVDDRLSPVTLDISFNDTGAFVWSYSSGGVTDTAIRQAGSGIYAGILTRPQGGSFWTGWDAGDDTEFTISLPSANGWNYQTYGAWFISTNAPNAHWETFSAGVVAPAGVISGGGTATFAGGLVVTSDGFTSTAGMTLAVDFAGRTAAFASTDWTDTRQTWPGTALGGVLTFPASQNRLSGTLTTANGAYSGPATGQFYGPQAEEVGGVFTLNGGGKTVLGAFGGKR